MPQLKPDCFAYRIRLVQGRQKIFCTVLTTMECGRCKFYKTVKQACAECTYDDCKGCVIWEQLIPKFEKK